MKYLLDPAFQIVDINGNPVNGGKVYVYNHGQSSLAVVYSDFEKHFNTNPVILDSLGHGTIIVESEKVFDVRVYDSKDLLLFSMDKVDSISGGGGGSGEKYYPGKNITISEDNIISSRDWTPELNQVSQQVYDEAEARRSSFEDAVRHTDMVKEDLEAEINDEAEARRSHVEDAIRYTDSVKEELENNYHTADYIDTNFVTNDDLANKHYSIIDTSSRGGHSYVNKLRLVEQEGAKLGTCRLLMDGTDAGYTVTETMLTDITDIPNTYATKTELDNLATKDDLSNYYPKTGGNLDGALRARANGGTSMQSIAPVYADVINVEDTSRIGLGTNGSIMGGDYNNTYSHTIGVRRKIGDKRLAGRFQLYSDGAVSFQQIENNGTADSIVCQLQYGQTTSGNNWGTMTFGSETKHIAFTEDETVFIATTSNTADEVNDAIFAGKRVVLYSFGHFYQQSGSTMDPDDFSYTFQYIRQQESAPGTKTNKKELYVDSYTITKSTNRWTNVTERVRLQPNWKENYGGAIALDETRKGSDDIETNMAETDSNLRSYKALVRSAAAAYTDIHLKATIKYELYENWNTESTVQNVLVDKQVLDIEHFNLNEGFVLSCDYCPWYSNFHFKKMRLTIDMSQCTDFPSGNLTYKFERYVNY